MTSTSSASPGPLRRRLGGQGEGGVCPRADPGRSLSPSPFARSPSQKSKKSKPEGAPLAQTTPELIASRHLAGELELPRDAVVVVPGVGDGAWVRAIRTVWTGAVIDRVDCWSQPVGDGPAGLELDRRPGELADRRNWTRWSPTRLGPYDLAISTLPRSASLIGWVTTSLEVADVAVVLLEDEAAKLPARGLWMAARVGPRLLAGWHRG